MLLLIDCFKVFFYLNLAVVFEKYSPVFLFFGGFLDYIKLVIREQLQQIKANRAHVLRNNNYSHCYSDFYALKRASLPASSERSLKPRLSFCHICKIQGT